MYWAARAQRNARRWVYFDPSDLLPLKIAKSKCGFPFDGSEEWNTGDSI